MSTVKKLIQPGRGHEWFRNGTVVKGFTLVELLVVIAIIGILATLVLLQLGGARARARDVQRISHINQIQGALELYWEDNGQYPDALSDLGQYFSGKTPQDPTKAADYDYITYDQGGRKIGYHVWAELEQNANALKSDSDIDSSSGGGWAGGGADGAQEGDQANKCTIADPCLYDRGVDPTQ